MKKRIKIIFFSLLLMLSSTLTFTALTIAKSNQVIQSEAVEITTNRHTTQEKRILNREEAEDSFWCLVFIIIASGIFACWWIMPANKNIKKS